MYNRSWAWDRLDETTAALAAGTAAGADGVVELFVALLAAPAPDLLECDP